jgi:hypothetical protein
LPEGSPARSQPGFVAAGPPGSSMPVAVGRERGQLMLVRTGLQLPPRLPFERWLAIGMQLSALHGSAAWCLGDWLAYGEIAYTGRYRQAVDLTCLDYQTLRNYAWVARRFSLSRRRDRLSFGHHCEVAALPVPEQDFWLRKAEDHHWPVKQLRRQVRASLEQRSAAGQQHTAGGDGQRDWVILTLQIRLSPAQLRACQAAADTASLTIQDWAALALQHATQASAEVTCQA